MAKGKELDFSGFDEEVEKELDFSGFDEESKPIEEGMGAGEAAALGAAEGASFGLDEILAGISGAAGRLVGRDKESEEKVKSEFKRLGIKDPEEIGDLLDTYYEAKGGHKQKLERASDEQPGAYYSGLLGGGVLGTGGAGIAAKGALKGGAKLAGAGLTKSGKVAKAASKVLPSIEKLGEGATTAQKIASAGKEGLKAGAITGFGKGEGKLFEGEIGETVKDIGFGAAGGAIIGGGLSTLGSATMGLLKKIPGVESAKFGFKYGLVGKDLTEEQVADDIKLISQEIYVTIQESLSQHGLDKRTINELANEAGVRVAAGDSVNNAIEDTLSRKAVGQGSTNKKGFIAALEELRGKSKEINKIEQRLEKKVLKKRLQDKSRVDSANIAAQKKALKESIKSGEQASDVEVDKVKMGDFYDDEAKSPVEMLERAEAVTRDAEVEGPYGLKMPGEKEVIKKQVEDITPFKPSKVKVGIDKKTGREYGYYKDAGSGKTVAEVGELAEDFIENIDDMTIQDAEALLNEVNRYTKYGADEPIIKDNEVISTATSLAKEIRSTIDTAIDEIGNSKETRGKLSSLLAAKEIVGIGKTLKKSRKMDLRAKVDKLRKMIGGTGDDARINRERFMEVLGEADPALVDRFENRVTELNKLKEIVGSKSASGSVSPKAVLFDSAREGIAKVSNLAGQGVSYPSRAGRKIIEKMGVSLDGFTKSNGPQLEALAAHFKSKGGAASSYAGALLKASAAKERTKIALLYGLYQQPGFRKYLKEIGEEITFSKEEEK